MHWTKRRECFRAILAGEACVHPGSVSDPISARIAEDLGFEAGMFAGSVASLAVIGAPDLVTLSLSEFAGQAYRINRAGNLPLLVDADHGYGNALGVKRCVEELETAGVAALTIEDTDLPTPFGATEKPRLIALAEGVGKMKAALAGRQDPSLAIVGRTSAAAVTGMEDCIARLRAYEAAGVDALFLTGLQTREQVQQVAAAVKLPLMLGQTPPAIADAAFLAGQRVRIALQGHLPYAAAVRAVYETLKALREGTPPSAIKTAASAELMARVTREADFKRWTREFLGG
ncbi:MAG: isocitrate lyase/PEP mutase family protein [Alphaproteobacteria bacterium]|nr:isocitrate lyase/PEP mutase family protein [Alphaproteobacteria bacterium]